MDNSKVNKYDLNKHCRVLAHDFDFANKLNSQARQSSAERAWSAIARFYDNCKRKISGKKRCDPAPPSGARERAPREGFPKFKHNCRSVEYKTTGWKLLSPKRIEFTDKNEIGRLKLVGTWDLTYYDESQIKRVRLVRKADGYYCQFCISIDVKIDIEPSKHVVGLDLGLKYFYADSDGDIEENPRFYRKSERQLNRANRNKSKKFRKGKPQSANYHKARNRYARKHLRVSRQREEYCKRLAYCVIHSNDVVAYEDLNVKGLVRNRHLAKSISDAGWSTFRKWLEYFGKKYGKVTVAVPPHYTSQKCSSCGEIVKKALSTRTHVCPHCGYTEDRDVNAAINILKLGLRTVGHTGTSTLGERLPLAGLEQSCLVTETR